VITPVVPVGHFIDLGDTHCHATKGVFASRDGQLRATVTGIARHTGHPRLFEHINDYYPFALVDTTTQICFRLPSSDSPSSSPVLPPITITTAEPAQSTHGPVRQTTYTIYLTHQGKTGPSFHSGEVYYYDLLIEPKVHQVFIAANLYHQPIIAKLRHLFQHLFNTGNLAQSPHHGKRLHETSPSSQLTRQTPNTLPSARVQTSDI